MAFSCNVRFREALNRFSQMASHKFCAKMYLLCSCVKIHSSSRWVPLFLIGSNVIRQSLNVDCGGHACITLSSIWGLEGICGITQTLNFYPESRFWGRCVTTLAWVQILGEMRETVPKEFDFLREAKLMRVIAARVREAGLKGVVIPEPLLALTSPQLLVMQRMPGQCTFFSLPFSLFSLIKVYHTVRLAVC